MLKQKNKRHVSWITKCKRAALNLPIEKRQEFLDYLWEGMSVGDAREKAGLSFDQASGVVMLNMKKVSFLNRESI